MTHLEKHPEALRQSAPPSVWGPVFWGELEEIVKKIPCGHCKGEALKMIRGYHAAKNVELGKPVYAPADLAWLDGYVRSMAMKCSIMGHCPSLKEVMSCRGGSCSRSSPDS